MTSGSSRDLLTLLEAQAALAADTPAIVTEVGTTMSRAEVLDRASAIACGLRAATDREADRPRIGIALPNGGDLALMLLGAMLAGMAVPFNPALGGEDADATLARARIDVLVAAPDTAKLAIVTAAARRGIPVLRRPDLAARGTGVGRLPRPDPEDIAVVLMTSGSTGGGKLVPLSHRNICVSAGNVARSMALGPGDRCLSMWEQHHIGGVVDLLLAPLVSGGSVVMTRGFDAGQFFTLVPEVRPTWFQGVPATLAELVLQARRRGHRGGGSLRLIRSVAAALPPSGLADLEEVFGVPVIQTFGMTEAGPLITSTALPPAKRKPGSVGRSCGPAIRILGPGGRDVTRGEVGEVAIQGENVFAGYEDDPAANARAFRDGWFLTGDLGRFDDEGGLFLTGRLKQMINRGARRSPPTRSTRY
jgi:oxalate---CoA ligase